MVMSHLYAKKTKKGAELIFSGHLVADAYAALPPQKIAPLVRNAPLLAIESFGLDTQILQGDKLRVLQRNIKHGGELWVEVELLDQPAYKLGEWVAKKCFIRQQDFSATRATWESNAIVKSLIAAVFAKPSIDSVKFGRLSVGTHLRVTREVMHGWAEVLLASGVVGCMRTTDLMQADVISRLPLQAKRSQVIATAKLFEKSPYRWGGCSGYDATNEGVTGVDCSSLVYLAYRSIGMHVPRDAHDQFLASSFIKFGRDVQPGDLVFLAHIDSVKNTARVDHVLIVSGRDEVIESTGHRIYSIKDLKDPSSACVRTITAQKHPRIKKSLREFHHGQLTDNGELIFFGTFLGNKALGKQLANGPIS
jgi:hypothetical protein